jgi:hypothetical protein
MYVCIFVFLKYVFFYYNYNFELYSVFSRIFISSFLTSSFKIRYLSAISMHPTAINVPSRNPNAIT